MDSESPSTLKPQQDAATPTVPSERKVIAPVWHTVVLIALILVLSFGGIPKVPANSILNSRIFVYSSTAVLELILVLLVWFGISRKGVTMRELIGGRWKSPEDFLMDVGIGVGFWLGSAVVLLPLKMALGLIDFHNPGASLRQMKEAVGPMIPGTGLELGLFLCLTVVAGLFEEIVFRGYLMKQLGALSGNIYVGVLASGILFGGAHGYQGVRQMVLIAALGVLFGLLAVWRKSLRPGMIAHAWTDAISGILLFFS